MLTHYILLGDPQDNLIHVFTLIRKEYKRSKIWDRYPKLTPTMIKQSKAKLPLLKGKAARIKSFGRALVVVFEELMNKTDPKHLLVLKGLKLSVRIDTIMSMYSDEYIYPPAIAEEFEDSCFEYCRVIVTLINAYHKADPPVPVFNYTIKAH